MNLTAQLLIFQWYTGIASGGRCSLRLFVKSPYAFLPVRYIPFWSLGIGEDGSAGALVFRRRLLAGAFAKHEQVATGSFVVARKA